MLRGNGAQDRAPFQALSDDIEVFGRKIEIRAQPREPDRIRLTGTVGVIGQEAAVPVIDDAVIRILRGTAGGMKVAAASAK